MPDLVQALQKQDLAFLRSTASLWGVELSAARPPEAAYELAATLLDGHHLEEMLETMPAEVRPALDALLHARGRIPRADFTRRFGTIRPAGPARREREQAHRHPGSPAEFLFYRALLAVAFFDTPSGPQEFVYIPVDLLPLLTAAPGVEAMKTPPGRPAVPAERRSILPAGDTLLDDAVTLLAAARLGIDTPASEIPAPVVAALLRAAGILAGNEPVPEAVKQWLELPPAAALDRLTAAWQESEVFNELRLLPGLVFEGEWGNEARPVRQRLLSLIRSIPVNRWWSLSAFVQDIHAHHPDFQRPAGDYDSWFIRRAADGVYLRGFTCWDEVDGALVRFLITRLLFWLGRVDLATSAQEGVVSAFRLKAKPELSRQDGRLTVASNGRIVIPRQVPRLVRYQVARFCEWEPSAPGEYRYRVTVQSLQRCAGQGLKVRTLPALLAKHAQAELPPAFVKAIKRWENRGTEARLETQMILRLSRAEVLEELHRSRAARFLGEVLNPTTVIVKPGAWSRVLAALAELGLLAEVLAPVQPQDPTLPAK